jgi:ssRNA-specific RNase YbeY (16S rRNA maturation enzyme)
VLHICGHDHAEPDEEAAMRALETRILQAHSPRSA